MNIKLKALIALLGQVLFFAILVILARAYVSDVSPFLMLFLRMLFASIAFLPFLLRSRVWKKSGFNHLVLVSLLSTLNVVFFIWGIQYTSASASQFIYSIQPILTIIVSNLFLKQKYHLRSFIGVVIGLTGIGYILYQSAAEKGETISGGISGNLAIMVAMVGWFSYIMLSKSLSRKFSPSEIGSISVFTSLIVSIVLLLHQIFFSGIPFHLTSTAWLVGIYMGIFGTFLTYLLIQISIKYLSPLTVNLSSYIQPILVTVLAIIFLGEKLTLGFLIGSGFVLFGVFLTATLDVLSKRR